jgi:hypothetical protein
MPRGTYISTKPCVKCGNVERYAAGSACVLCQRKARASWWRSEAGKQFSRARKAALKAKHVRGDAYTSGKLCVKCGGSLRLRSNSACVKCNKEGLRRLGTRPEMRQKRREAAWCKAGVRVGGVPLTYEKFQESIAQQRGVCAICETRVDESAHVDHDHTTGQFRGVLCSDCNHLLGFFEKAQKYLGRIQRYLRCVNA